jgi:hypothetical protein
MGLDRMLVGGLVIALCMMLGGFMVGFRCVLVMFCCLLMCIVRHGSPRGTSFLAPETVRRHHTGKHLYFVKIPCRFAPSSVLSGS